MTTSCSNAPLPSSRFNTRNAVVISPGTAMRLSLSSSTDIGERVTTIGP